MPDVQRSKICDWNISRIRHNQGRSALEDSLPDLIPKYRMLLRCIGTDDEESLRVLRNVIHRIGHCARAKCSRQTGDSGRVSKTGTVIYTVRANHLPGKFLEKVILFVRAFCRCQYTDRVWAVLSLDLN